MQAGIAANKRVSHQINSIKSDTVVSGEEAVVHFVKHELRAQTTMQRILIGAASRDMSSMTMQEQVDAMRAENRAFGKVLISEKEMQVAAFAIRSDKETWAKVSKDKTLAALVDQKAKQKPSAILADYQMAASNPNKETMVSLLEESVMTHGAVAQSVVNTPELAAMFKAKAPRLMAGLKRFDAQLKQEQAAAKQQETKAPLSPLNIKNIQMKKQR